ncbi:MAG: hypothetical protein IJW13_01135 [Clostridia bacterium]|nr:hypothetical protein [Clostridia bacterium]
MHSQLEVKLINKMNQLHKDLIRGIMIRHDLWYDWSDLTGRLCVIITQDRHMSVSEAASYINYSTGEFKPGKYMHVCVNDEAARMYNNLKQVARLQNELNQLSATQILLRLNEQKKEIKQIIDSMRSVWGESVANKRLKQLLDAYPHLKNTFSIKGVNEMNFDMRICYLDANSGYFQLDPYLVNRKKTERGICDDILFSYTQRRIENEKVSKYLIKEKYSYNVESNGKFIQGWKTEEVNKSTSYRGEYLNGMKNAYGSLFVKDNYIYHGSFVNEVKEGYGVCLYLNGDCYEGWWRANDWQGEGRLYKKDGSVQTGMWNHGLFVSSWVSSEPLRVTPMQVGVQEPKKTASSVSSTNSSGGAPKKAGTEIGKTPSKVAENKTVSPSKVEATTSAYNKPVSSVGSYSSARVDLNKQAAAPSGSVNLSISTATSALKPIFLAKESDMGYCCKETYDGKTGLFGVYKWKTGGHYACEKIGRFYRKEGMCLVEYKEYLHLGFFSDGNPNGYGLILRRSGTAYFGKWKAGELIQKIKEYSSIRDFNYSLGRHDDLKVDLKEFINGYERSICTYNEKGQKHGCGLCEWRGGSEKGKRYLGYFKDDFPYGVGIFTYPNGCIYIGSVSINFRSGEGLLIKENGECVCGKWFTDNLV